MTHPSLALNQPRSDPLRVCGGASTQPRCRPPAHRSLLTEALACFSTLYPTEQRVLLITYTMTRAHPCKYLLQSSPPGHCA